MPDADGGASVAGLCRPSLGSRRKIDPSDCLPAADAKPSFKDQVNAYSKKFAGKVFGKVRLSVPAASLRARHK